MYLTCSTRDTSRNAIRSHTKSLKLYDLKIIQTTLHSFPRKVTQYPVWWESMLCSANCYRQAERIEYIFRRYSNTSQKAKMRHYVYFSITYHILIAFAINGCQATNGSGYKPLLCYESMYDRLSKRPETGKQRKKNGTVERFCVIY